METPPAYMPKQKKSNAGLIIAIVLGSLALCCILMIAGAGIFGVNFFNTKLKPMAECMMAFSDIQDAVILYTEDHKGTLPDAEKWQDEVGPYLDKAIRRTGKDRGPFKSVKADELWGCSDGERKTGIAFNSTISGKKLADIPSKEGTAMIFEIESASRNAHEVYHTRPDNTSPTMMGEHRGWIMFPIEGEGKLGKKRKKSFNFNSSSSTND